MFEKQFTDLSTDNIESKTGFLSTPELFWGRIRLYLFKGPPSYSCCQSLDLLLLGVECSQGLSGNGILSRTYHLALQQCFAFGLYYDADVEFKLSIYI